MLGSSPSAPQGRPGPFDSNLDNPKKNQNFGWPEGLPHGPFCFTNGSPGPFWSGIGTSMAAGATWAPRPLRLVWQRRDQGPGTKAWNQGTRAQDQGLGPGTKGAEPESPGTNGPGPWDQSPGTKGPGPWDYNTPSEASNTACVSLAQIWSTGQQTKNNKNHQTWYEPGSGVSL